MQQVYLIGNAHIDPVWLWRKTEGMSEILATFRSALDRMEAFPDYIFTSACAVYYQWVEKVDPGMLEEIRQRVREGRWCIAGGFWVQPDCNLPCGESFARHALYSQGYFQRTFGKAARVGYCVDSFGHNAMLPQLLQKSGMTAYVFMRPDARENPSLPDLFRWISPDGSQVTAARIQLGYGDFSLPEQERAAYEGQHVAAAKAQVLQRRAQQDGLPRMAFYGIGNHGGGPSIQALRALQPLHERNAGIRYAGVEQMFDDLREGSLLDQLPQWKSDLQHHASGCYAALSAIKAANRRAECALIAAENINTLSHLLTGERLATNRLQIAWQQVLFNQFHDILTGCSIKEAYQDALDELGYARAVAADVLRLSAQRIAWRVKTSRAADMPAQKNGWVLWEQQGQGAPMVIINPHAFPVRCVVQANITVAGVMDAAGQPVACQQVRGPQTNGTDKHNTIFTASVPALGHATYYLDKDMPCPAPAGGLRCGADFLENEHLRVRFDKTTGHIVQFVDKRTARDYASAPMAGAVVIDDSAADTWAHGIFTFDKEMGRFDQAVVELIEEGPVRAGIRVSTHYGASTLTQEFLLAAGSPQLEVRCRIHLQHKHAIVKLAFPVQAENPGLLLAMLFGYIEKPCDGVEQPGQQWAALYDKDNGAGLALINDSKYSFSAQGSELRMAVARSAIYADHYGVRDEQVHYQDQDEMAFTYALRPFSIHNTADAVTAAQALNQPVHLVLDTHHGGTLPSVAGSVTISTPNVLLTTLKRAEDNTGWILRLVEIAGRTAQAQVHLPALNFHVELSFRPMEIKTLRVQEDGSFVEVLLTEMPFAR